MTLRIALLAFLALAATAASAAAAPLMPKQISIQQSTLGPVFATADGFSLYVSKLEKKPGISNCYSDVERDASTPMGENYSRPRPDYTCVMQWHPYLASADAQPTGDFEIIARKDGGRQWAYQGQPLYRYVDDRKPGDTNGQRIGTYPGLVPGNVRTALLVPFEGPAGLSRTRIAQGLVLADEQGMTLYVPTGKSGRCDAACEMHREPVLAPAVAHNMERWTTIRRKDGDLQWAYDGKPLYRFSGDIKEHQANGVAEGWAPALIQEAAKPPAVFKVAKTTQAPVITDGNGATLYTWICNEQSASRLRCDGISDTPHYRIITCGGVESCKRLYRPVRAEARAKALAKGDWSVISYAPYPDEAPQPIWAFRGMPLYTYAGDAEPGDVRGNYVRWFTVGQFNAVAVPDGTEQGF